MKSVAAVVVTYNRKELLKEAIDALLMQSVAEADVLVVDNASTDGTKDYIADYIDQGQIIYINTGENLGGAGGFNFGMRKACEAGYKYVWIMDDDAIVKRDALKELLKADQLLKGDYGYLSSTVFWTDGQPCVMNRPKLVKDWTSDLGYLSAGLVRTYYSTFVSFFVKTATVKELGLPIKDFFIWGDDVEYSNRLSKKYPCYVVGKSQVIHKTRDNNGSNIAKEQGDRIGRYKFANRNECVIARENGMKGRLRQFAKVNYNMLRVIFTHNPHKLKKLGIILGASVEGIFFRPEIEYIEEQHD